MGVAVVMPMFYSLEDSGHRQWVIKGLDGQCYRAGRTKHLAQLLVDGLNEAPRPNVEQRSDGLYVCWNQHDKCQACRYVREIEYGD